MNERDIEELDPKERTLRVLKGLDDMLTAFAEQEHVASAMSNHRHISPDMIDRHLTEKITNALRWVTGNLNAEEINSLIDSVCKNGMDMYYLHNADVIKNLLKEKYFNVRMYN